MVSVPVLQLVALSWLSSARPSVMLCIGIDVADVGLFRSRVAAAAAWFAPPHIVN